jgi:chemotaxis protein MotD
VFNVSIDPATSSPSINVRPPSRPDQNDRPDDFSALVDSNTQAANDAGSAATYARSRSNNDQTNSTQTNSSESDNSGASATNQQQSAPAPSSSTANQQTTPPQNPPSNQTARPDAAPVQGNTKGKPAKSAKADNPDQPQKPAGTDAVNPNAPATPVAVVAATPVVTDPAGAKSDATEAAGTTTAAQAAANAQGAKQIIDPSTGQPISKSAQTESDDKASAAAAAQSGQTQPAGGTATPPVAVGILPQAAYADGKATDGTKGVSQIAGGKLASKSAQTKSTAVDQAAAKSADASDKSSDTAAATTDDSDSAKADASSAKADASQTAGAVVHDKHGVDPQAPKPDANFQSVLDLQTQPPQQQTTPTFTVTNAGPTGSTQAASAPVPVSGLAVDIASKAAAGNTSFQIRLDPADLGRIDVRLDVDKHGQVTSHLTVERPATLEMLRNDAPKLQQALEDAGLKTGDNGLQFSLRDQSSQGRNDNTGQNGPSQRLIVSEDAPATATPAATNYTRPRGSSAGVDISI